jgi:hypothetical protein
VIELLAAEQEPIWVSKSVVRWGWFRVKQLLLFRDGALAVVVVVTHRGGVVTVCLEVVAELGIFVSNCVLVGN